MNSETHKFLKKALKKLESIQASFDYLQISVASPERIKSWSQRIIEKDITLGEILSPNTLNYRTHKPEPDGLFCEKIFGPIHDWCCSCGKYSGFLLNKICENCLVELISSRVRRYRMGYIELIYPVVHLWYLKSRPNYLYLLLKSIDPKISSKEIENILYFKQDILENSPLQNYIFHDRSKKREELTSFFNHLRNFYKNYELNGLDYAFFLSDYYKYLNIQTPFKRSGAEILKCALEDINLEYEIFKLRNFSLNISFQEEDSLKINEKFALKQLRLLESFFSIGIKPSWIFLTVFPILPPALRPMLFLEDNQLITSDINNLYRLLIFRNYNLFETIVECFDLEGTEKALFSLLFQSKKLLQQTTDAIINNSRLKKNDRTLVNNRPAKGITELLEGKGGIFRYNLLGKRVDFSGRSAITVEPKLKLSECTIPFEIAIELFTPFLIQKLFLLEKNPYYSWIVQTKLTVQKGKPIIWRLLQKFSRQHTILLNRAPTLHKYGIQAFDARITMEKSIQLHPLVCAGFNADFDGDQMAIHLPLFNSSQVEAKTLMRPMQNILSISNGDVILRPTQDMVIGCYYLTIQTQRTKGKKLVDNLFLSEEDAILAFENKQIAINETIFLHLNLNDFDKIQRTVRIENNILKCDMPISSFYTDEPQKVLKAFSYYSNLYVLTKNILFLLTSLNVQTFLVKNCWVVTTVGKIIFTKTITN